MTPKTFEEERYEVSVQNNQNEIIVENIRDIKNLSGSFLGDYLSYSFIAGWKGCPAKQIMNALEPVTKNQYLIIGSATHSLLERAYSNPGGLTQEDISEILDPIQEQEYKDKALEYYNAYYRINPYTDLSNASHYTEKEFISKVHPLGVNDLPVLKGFIDRIDVTNNGIYVIDYKTCSSDTPKNKHRDQLTMYKWLVEENLGVKVKDCMIASLFIKDPKYVSPEITLSSQSEFIDDIMKVQDEVRESLRSGIYPKKFGTSCNFCCHLGTCMNCTEIESPMMD